MNYMVIDALKKALKEQPNHGICQVIEDLALEDAQAYYELLFESCEALGLFSGTLTMPISVDHGEPYALYRNARRKRKMWKSTTRYGAARRNVANRMIKELEDADRKAQRSIS